LTDPRTCARVTRVALAAIAPTPVSATEAAEWLAGKPANEESFAAAGELARKVASPIDDMRGTAEYRVHLVDVLVKRTLAKAVQRAGEQSGQRWLRGRT